MTLFLVSAALGAAGWPDGIPAAVVAVGFTTGLPLAGVLLLVRSGHLSDHHISDRRQRAPVLAATLVSIAAGLGVLALLDTPRAVLAAVLSTVAGVVAVLVVNLWWKLSAHCAVAAFVTVGSFSLFGTGAAPLALMSAAVGWSRVRLGAHTPAQVAAGYLVGAVIGAAFAVFLARA
ncbi:phosphatidic acid phosphatase [Arthrobacter sp. NPDC092385]|uniref:phosphatidic acid phosphatase n=1 Tax=Arthrobacter sp. NPDC092385 TaxID=3363943 RepID=UPI0037FFB18F